MHLGRWSAEGRQSPTRQSTLSAGRGLERRQLASRTARAEARAGVAGTFLEAAREAFPGGARAALR
eukprot:scaffold161374_cov27-Tisochrysis_lutea.AAC.4